MSDAYQDARAGGHGRSTLIPTLLALSLSALGPAGGVGVYLCSTSEQSEVGDGGMAVVPYWLAGDVVQHLDHSPHLPHVWDTLFTIESRTSEIKPLPTKWAWADRTNGAQDRMS